VVEQDRLRERTPTEKETEKDREKIKERGPRQRKTDRENQRERTQTEEIDEELPVWDFLRSRGVGGGFPAAAAFVSDAEEYEESRREYEKSSCL
jgi:hypothetical protein